MDTNIKTLPVNLNALKHQFPDSHKIHAYEHGSDGHLYVQYKSNAHKVTYVYPDHPIDDVEKLHAAESKGGHFNKAWVTTYAKFDKLPGTTQTVVWPNKA